MDDPFFIVKGEVVQALESAHSLYVRWQTLHNSTDTATADQYQWATTELSNTVRSIDWDLEDLSDTVNIVEQNPQRFNISIKEIAERKDFINQSKATVQDIRAALANHNAPQRVDAANRTKLLKKAAPPSNRHGKYTRLEQALSNDNQALLDSKRREHRMEIEEQDRSLMRVGQSVGVLKNIGTEIGRELDEQEVLIDDLDEAMGNTESQLVMVTKKVTRVLDNMSDRKQVTIIIFLLCVLLILVLLYSVL